jgi:arylsulfatase A
MNLSRREFLTAAAAGPLTAQRSSRPNVIVFLTDDMGYGDIGPYGVRDTKTPHLDRMAREGVRFLESYSNGPVCTPTRAGLMTGRYQQRVGLEWAIIPAQTDAGLPTSEITLARMLREDGYRTAMFGKWHLGSKPEFGPNAHGFSEFFGILGGNVDMYTHQNINGTPDLYENTELVRREGYLTDLLTARAEKFVDTAEPGKPFFLYVPYNSAHWPFQPPGRPDARTRENWMHGSRADYIKMVENIDDGVGRVLGALDRRKLADNTLVVFTNDNGGERFSRNEPFFHHKATLWEGGIRVPTLMRWPGRIPAGAISRQPMITMDITASVLAATGTRPPAGRTMEGIDLMPVVSGRKPETERTFFWRIDRADRKQKAVRRKNFKYVRDGAIEMLMDIAKDPAERHDIAPQHPEMMAELRQALELWEKEMDRNAPAMIVR